MKEQDIIKRLQAIDTNKTVASIVTEMIDILKLNPHMTMLDFENLFRKGECENTYFVAWPKPYIPRGFRAVRYDGTEPPYALWVCVNGVEDMRGQIAEFNLSAKENLHALMEAGIGITQEPVPAEGSKLKHKGIVQLKV